MELKEAMETAGELLEKAAEQVVRSFFYSQNKIKLSTV
jgi:hypothetical protein